VLLLLLRPLMAQQLLHNLHHQLQQLLHSQVAVGLQFVLLPSNT
jgi:hypothetical protein